MSPKSAAPGLIGFGRSGRCSAILDGSHIMPIDTTDLDTQVRSLNAVLRELAVNKHAIKKRVEAINEMLAEVELPSPALADELSQIKTLFANNELGPDSLSNIACRLVEVVLTANFVLGRQTEADYIELLGHNSTPKPPSSTSTGSSSF